MKAILGKKVGMTQIFKESGEVVPVTVIEAGPEVVTQIKTLEKDGYNAVQVGFEDQKPHRVNKPLTGHFEKSGVTPKKHVAEFRNDEGETYELGQVINDLAGHQGHDRCDRPGPEGPAAHRGGGARGLRLLPGRHPLPLLELAESPRIVVGQARILVEHDHQIDGPQRGQEERTVPLLLPQKN